ncbi:D-alanyl-D-alanine dipeptidase [Salinisphaera sp. G21_0]|uniref:D-alanyl-D-alanine dipeptidase n=1 Tax=Salinisphaera sp. G21_0 TaxID=2821094 RepID=UPI001ADA4EDB|nr:D-alanyl-D-alanine dipeptidase [Salinisphaera sp. G21_0]MBO9482368.1 D-alanyl-D-alanine dipeptidase [Salinisphaera sp. G21_0]
MKAPTELKLITAEQFGIDIDMAYATSNNFTGHPIYKSHDCYLHPLAAQGIKRASELLRPLNLTLKVWDAFRPITAQAELFRFFPDPDYVSDPESGLCSHCRGIAIDLTIIDHFGHELEMGTPFDDFRPLAHHGNDQISAEAQRNRLLLAGVMNLAGFDPLDTEWWHYQLPEAKSYPIIKPEQKPSTLT